MFSFQVSFSLAVQISYLNTDLVRLHATLTWCTSELFQGSGGYSPCLSILNEAARSALKREYTLKLWPAPWPSEKISALVQ